ncbi:MAG TPA: hypothetical protein HA230_05525 [Candidatus Aenigmarchaeota archaeon]|nr:hypothetical protein [Candidatus Aenigmarchaeota archaeon]
MAKKIIFILLLLTMLASLGHAASRTDALLAINQSQNDMKEMMGAGFSANSVNDTIGAMRQALERADFAEMLRQNATGSLAEQARKALEGLNYEGFTYDSVVAYGNQTAVRKQKAFDLYDSIRALEIRIDNTFGLNLSDATVLIGQAKEEFQKEHYDQAQQYLTSANTILETKKAEATTLSAMVESGRSFIEKYWQGLLGLIILIIVLSWFGREKYNRRNLKKKIRRMKAEKITLNHLMKETQRDRFETGKLSAPIYEIRMDKYNKRINDIDQKLPVLEVMLKGKKLKKKNYNKN